MKSQVFFTPVKDADDIDAVNRALKVLLAKSAMPAVAEAGNKVAVKLHFGEEGTDAFVRPDHLRIICDELTGRGALPYLSDANTLYRGMRLNSTDHMGIALEHGFTRDAVGVDIFIPDDTKEQDVVELVIDQKLIKTASVGRCYVDADAFVAVTHFKGHGLTGFGGSLKNVGMGCATRRGKLAQHCDAAPTFYEDKCIGCGECEKVCPVGAIQIENDKSVLSRDKCIGCANCVAACPNAALFVDFKAGDDVQKKMVEFAYAILKNKKGKAAFLNFALRINKECDCWRYGNQRIAPDVGIFASTDPVAIDKASQDLVNAACGKDVFKEFHPDQHPHLQLEYARDIGLGSIDYELIKV
ncbi:MAG: DUF362 domain-containing protein [Syntrophobacteraceae bacterium]|nr:DUF362 domain-containing protein [Syntrophobacteraceae bacterium]